MPRLEGLFAYVESHRVMVCSSAAVMIALIAWCDALLPTMSIGFLYLLPILLSAATLNRVQIIGVAIVCSVLREAFDPLEWSAGASGRILTAGAGFAMTGFFVANLNHRRRLLARHLAELEKEMRLRHDAESQLRTLIETSPLAILTLNAAGYVVLANESARELLGFDDLLPGTDIAPHLPILKRMLRSYHSSGNIRTNVWSKAKRRNGDVFLASVWLSTYNTSSGPGLAALIWDASEDLRARESAGVDSMLATSRVLIGAISHEIRNLASAAAASLSAMKSLDGAAPSEHYEALGSLIGALQSIASSGLQLASRREMAVADLGTVLDEARIIIEPSLRDAGFQITWKLESELPLVQADQHSLLQVFVNLARNIEEHAGGRPEREVSISATVENDVVVVRFQDSGPGVAHPEELFKPFQPGSSSSGLGLYISRAILRAYSGNLRYEPCPAGACFAVELWPIEKSGEG